MWAERLLFKRKEAPSPGEQMTGALPEVEGRQMKAKLLIVDDEPFTFELYTAMLEGIGEFECEYACDGPSAIELARHNEYFLVLLDQVMPGMDGLECAKALHNTFQTWTPIIFVTGKADTDQHRQAGFSAGAVDYLIKPVMEEELATKVRHFYLSYRNRHTLQQSFEQLRSHESIMAQSGEGIVGYDSDLQINYLNAAAAKMLGTQVSALLGRSIRHLFPPGADEKSWRESQFVRQAEEGVNVDASTALFYRANSHLQFPVSYSMTSVFEQGVWKGGVLLFQDHSERMRLERELVELATLDSATGLMNRASIYQRLEQRLLDAQATNQAFLLILVGIDNFKSINDNFGQVTGDLFLKQFGQRLKSFFPSNADIGRLGGDEFIVICNGSGIEPEQDARLGQILESVKRPFRVVAHEIYCTVSMGIAVFPLHGESSAQLITAADTAMYTAKQEGKDRFCFFSERQQQVLNKQFKLSLCLRQTVYDKEFRMVYQPKYNLKDLSMCGAEALLRWNSPELGNVPPSQFIPVAESAGEINDITRWCLATVIEDTRRWNEGKNLDKPLRVALNASPLDLRQGGFVDMVLKSIYSARLNPTWVELEVTETAIMAEPELAISALQRLRQHGIRISVDDFGTGYSSLNYLKLLPANYLKIDQSFIQGIGTSFSDEKIIRAIVQLAHSLDLKVIAEGIETREQLLFLQALKCDYGQGFYFCRPVEKDQIGPLFQRRMFGIAH